jgi:hypothetical protein
MIDLGIWRFLFPTLLAERGVELLQARETALSFRKEVIQPQVLLQLPCYDFTPIARHTMDGYPPKVGAPASGTTDFRDVTGGVYKARERIHPSMLIWDY